MNACSLYKLYHFHTVMLFLLVTCKHFLIIIIIISSSSSSGDATVTPFFWTLLTLQLRETSELLDESDNKISRLTARLAISKILAGLKERHPMWGATLGDARVKVKKKKKKKEKKRKKKKRKRTDRQTAHLTWVTGRQKLSRSAGSLVSSGLRAALTSSHTLVFTWQDALHELRT